MANIIKNAIMFMEKTFEQSTKIKRIIIFTLKCIIYAFLEIIKITNSEEKMLIRADLKE